MLDDLGTSVVRSEAPSPIEPITGPETPKTQPRDTRPPDGGSLPRVYAQTQGALEKKLNKRDVPTYLFSWAIFEIFLGEIFAWCF
jgi:hypothetical protein